MTGTFTFHVRLDDRATPALERVAEAFRQLAEAFLAFTRAAARAFGRLLRTTVAPLRWLRRYEPQLLAAEQGWQGLARRHAERPPTRGYWVKRCQCAACCLRRVLRIE